MATTTLNFLINFYRIIDANGSMTWTISEDKISVLHYFNDKNTDLQKIFDMLNSLDNGYGLAQRSWKLPFRMQVSDCESWNHDFFTKIEFIVNR